MPASATMSDRLLVLGHTRCSFTCQEQIDSCVETLTFDCYLEPVAGHWRHFIPLLACLMLPGAYDLARYHCWLVQKGRLLPQVISIFINRIGSLEGRLGSIVSFELPHICTSGACFAVLLKVDLCFDHCSGFSFSLGIVSNLFDRKVNLVVSLQSSTLR